MARTEADDMGGGAAPPRDVDILIIGAGFAGLGAAVKLKEAGRTDFVILEQAGAVGGTWRDNTYPGCACDVPSQLYSYSFAPKADWSRAFAPQAEIRAYIEQCVDRYALRPFLRFHARVSALHFDETHAQWEVHLACGGRYRARAVIAGTGPLSRPAIPDLPGLSDFKGTVFHSARWDHGHDLTGRRVAVVGTGASAIQFVPRIAPKVARMDVYQRTPPWIMPRMDKPVPGWAKALYRRIPGVQRLRRACMYAGHEWQALAFTRMPGMMRLFQRLAKIKLRKQVRDPDLRARLTPDYTMGCKRILLSDDYYPALQRETVSLVTDGIARVEADGLVTEAGEKRPADTIVFGTGFRTGRPFEGIDVTGRGGRRMDELLAERAPEAYLGTMMHGFPNLFLMVGPNTGLGHNSVIYMIECQVAMVQACLDWMDRAGHRAMDVKRDAQDAFNADLQKRMHRTVWQRGGCASWYQNSDGRNVALWPDFSFIFRRRTARLDPAAFEPVAPASSPHPDPVESAEKAASLAAP